jgi:hypothetical protein
MVRRHFTGVPNAYCLVHFACCREIKKISDLDLEKLTKELEEKITKQLEEDMLVNELEEENKEDSINRGDTNASINIGNFTLIYGCQPGAGVSATSKIIADLVNLYNTNFDPDKG